MELLAKNRLNLIKSIGLSKSIPKRGYYVYVITENDSICYIGKGKQYRVLSHFKNSSNHTLNLKIRENKNNYDWHILEEFDNEYDCLNYEEELILNCKRNKHKLYNVIHNSKGKQYNKLIIHFFNSLRLYEQNTYEQITDPNILTIKQVTEIYFEIIKNTCKKLIDIPRYKGKPLNELSFIEQIQNDRVRIVVY